MNTAIEELIEDVRRDYPKCHDDLLCLTDEQYKSVVYNLAGYRYTRGELLKIRKTASAESFSEVIDAEIDMFRYALFLAKKVAA